jgi:hypothetical protein
MTGENLDMPGSGYTSWNTFHPGQTPAAVVVGYGYWDGSVSRPQDFSLEVVELPTGNVIIRRSGEAHAGKAAVLDLPIRKSGSYSVRLRVNGSIYDTWNFTVDREAIAGEGGPASAAAYAKGNFSASLDPSCLRDAFLKYDEQFLQDVMNAVGKEEEKGPQEMFAQVAPGQVTVRFDLGEKGGIRSPQIVTRTLNETLAGFFLRALTNGAPYRPWPASATAANAQGWRPIQLVLYYD